VAGNICLKPYRRQARRCQRVLLLLLLFAANVKIQVGAPRIRRAFFQGLGTHIFELNSKPRPEPTSVILCIT